MIEDKLEEEITFSKIVQNLLKAVEETPYKVYFDKKGRLLPEVSQYHAEIVKNLKAEMAELRNKRLSFHKKKLNYQ